MEADASLATAAPPATRGVSQQAFDDGWAAIREGKFDDAAAAFERVASSRDARIASDAMYWRAVALARGQRNADASSAFTAFLDAHASSARAAEASVMLGWILFDQGDYAAAKRRFRAGLDAASARVRTSATDGMRAVDQVAD